MDKTLFIEKLNGKEVKPKFTVSKLLYYFVVVGFLAIMVSSVSFAKFSSNLASSVQADVAAIRLEFSEGGTGTIELTGLQPGDSQTYYFDVMNYDSQNRLVEFAIKYRIVVETASLLDLNFALSQKVNSNWTAVATSNYIDPETSFTVIYGTENSLPYVSAKRDEFKLVVSWPNASDNENLLTTDGEFIKVGVDWKQDIA